MTPQDFDFLRKLLRDRSGLVLSAEKQYLAESRLLPVARQHGFAGLGDLVGRLKNATPFTPLSVQVVEAMTTNESFFFRDKTPFDLFTSHMLPAMLSGRSPAQPTIMFAARMLSACGRKFDSITEFGETSVQARPEALRWSMTASCQRMSSSWCSTAP